MENPKIIKDLFLKEFILKLRLSQPIYRIIL